MAPTERNRHVLQAEHSGLDDVADDQAHAAPAVALHLALTQFVLALHDACGGVVTPSQGLAPVVSAAAGTPPLAPPGRFDAAPAEPDAPLMAPWKPCVKKPPLPVVLPSVAMLMSCAQEGPQG